METSDVVMDVVAVGALLVGIVTLCVAALTLRSARSAVHLAEARNEYLREEQTRLAQLREQHKTLKEELVRERQERWSLQEELNQEHGKRLDAVISTSWAAISTASTWPVSTTSSRRNSPLRLSPTQMAATTTGSRHRPRPGIFEVWP